MFDTLDTKTDTKIDTKTNANAGVDANMNANLCFEISFPDKVSLYNAYMPYLQNGGLFIATAVDMGEYYLEQPVSLNIQLPNADTQDIHISSKVAWITPSGAFHKIAGIGVEFDDNPESKKLRALIEEILGQALYSNRATHIL